MNKIHSGIVISWAALALSVLMSSGCSSAPVSPGPAKPDPAHEYAIEKESLETSQVISPGFMLKIRHGADEGISGEYRVSFKGDLKLPYKVKVDAAGKTTDELAQDLVKAYGSYFKSRNTVKVDIASREYFIELRGLVKKPGVYAVKLDTSIEEAIALAGGLTSSVGDAQASASTAASAKPEYLRIVRRDFRSKENPPQIRWIRLTDYFLKYDIKNEVLWRGGEQLFFQVTGDPNVVKPLSQTVQIIGEVRQPGEYAIQPGSDLHTYLTRAGGPTSSANLEDVVVIQKVNNDSNSYNISKSMAVAEVAPGDVILVKAIDARLGFFERLGPLFISIGSFALSIVIAIATL